MTAAQTDQAHKPLSVAVDGVARRQRLQLALTFSTLISEIERNRKAHICRAVLKSLTVVGISSKTTADYCSCRKRGGRNKVLIQDTAHEH